MKKIIYIILLMMGICSYLTNATCYSLTKYYFDGLSPTTNKIEGNTDPLNYPIITFPNIRFCDLNEKIGYSSPSTANDPLRSTAGIWISRQKYADISGKWSYNEHITDVSMWLYYKSGVLDVFFQFGLENIQTHPRLIKLKGELVGGTQYFNAYLGTFNTSISQVKYGWNLIGIDLWYENFGRNLCYYGVCSGYLYSYLDGIGALLPTDKLFIGCKYCTANDVSYLINGINFYKFTPGWIPDICVYALITNAMPNSYYPCGNSIREGSETCDDGNVDDCDGCSSQCQIEPGYTCTDPGSSAPDICSEALFLCIILLTLIVFV